MLASLNRATWIVVNQYRQASTAKWWAIVRWLALLPAAIVAYVCAGVVINGAMAALQLPVTCNLAAWAFSDWVGTLLFIIVCTETAPGHKGKVALASLVPLSGLHAVMLIAAKQHPISAVYSSETITITALGGFLLSGITSYAVFCSQRNALWQAQNMTVIPTPGNIERQTVRLTVKTENEQISQEVHLANCQAVTVFKAGLMLGMLPAKFLTLLPWHRPKTQTELVEVTRPKKRKLVGWPRMTEFQRPEKDIFMPDPRFNRDRFIEDSLKASRHDQPK